MNAQEAVAVLRGVQEHQGLYIDVRTAIQVLCDEVERLRAQIADQAMTDLVRETERLGLYQIEQLTAERDAALAELAGLSADHLQANLDLLGREQRVTALYEELKAWRACADRLAAAINNGFGAHITTPAGEALAVYERLKAGTP